MTATVDATVPVVAVVSECVPVSYAEVITSISTAAAGPEARAGIDEFIETTCADLRSTGGAQRSKAVLILNPADPPLPTRHTVYCLVDGEFEHDTVEQRIEEAVSKLPGYRLKQQVQFETIARVYIPETGDFSGTRITVMLDVAPRIG